MSTLVDENESRLCKRRHIEDRALTPTEPRGEDPDPRQRDDVAKIVAFDPDEVRLWRYHNRTRSGMDDESLDALAASIRRTDSSNSVWRAGFRRAIRTRSRRSSEHVA